MLTYTLYGPPRTKKNSQQIRRTAAGRPFVAPSRAFAEYERSCLAQIKTPYRPVSDAVNVKCVYYMPTKRQNKFGRSDFGYSGKGRRVRRR